MSLCLPVKDSQYVKLFSVYAPTLQAEPTEKDKLYSEICSSIQSTPAYDKVVVLGDFNARVGQDASEWRGVRGRHGVGNCNGNGRLLFMFCTEQHIFVTNTISSKRTVLKQHGCIVGPNICT